MKFFPGIFTKLQEGIAKHSDTPHSSTRNKITHTNMAPMKEQRQQQKR